MATAKGRTEKYGVQPRLPYLLTAGCEFAQQMADGGQGMTEHHAWPGPAHDRPYLFLHIGSVAVDGAFPACGLVRAIPASVKATVGIGQQFLALRAQPGMGLVLAAVQTNHLLHHRLFFLDASGCHRGATTVFCAFSHHLALCTILPASSHARRDKSSAVSCPRRCRCFRP